MQRLQYTVPNFLCNYALYTELLTIWPISQVTTADVCCAAFMCVLHSHPLTSSIDSLFLGLQYSNEKRLNVVAGNSLPFTLSDAAVTFRMCHTLQVSDSCCGYIANCRIGLYITSSISWRFYISSRNSPRGLLLMDCKLLLFLTYFPLKDQPPFSLYAPQRNPL